MTITIDVLLLAFYAALLFMAVHLLWALHKPLETALGAWLRLAARWADGRCTEKRSRIDRELGVRE